jgi:hypothetical protein
MVSFLFISIKKRNIAEGFLFKDSKFVNNYTLSIFRWLNCNNNLKTFFINYSEFRLRDPSKSVEYILSIFMFTVHQLFWNPPSYMLVNIFNHKSFCMSININVILEVRCEEERVLGAV